MPVVTKSLTKKRIPKPPAKKAPVKRNPASAMKREIQKNAPALKNTAKTRTRDHSRNTAARIINRQMNPLQDEWVEGTELPSGATPLDVMVEAMRRAYKKGGPFMAFKYAEACAPYLHGKIANITLTLPMANGMMDPSGVAAVGNTIRNSMLVEFVDTPPPEKYEDDVVDVPSVDVSDDPEL